MSARNDKTERLSAADFQAQHGKGKSAAKPPVPRGALPLATPPITAGRYSFTYSGPGISSNAFYAGLHWSKRKALVAKYHRLLAPLIEAANIQPMQQFRVGVCYHSKQDVDNITALVKVVVDMLKGVYVPEDSPAYFKALGIEYAPELPNNTFVFTISEIR